MACVSTLAIQLQGFFSFRSKFSIIKSKSDFITGHLVEGWNNIVKEEYSLNKEVGVLKCGIMCSDSRRPDCGGVIYHKNTGSVPFITYPFASNMHYL